MSEFKPFPKIPRLNRDCVITEKIDGTNACVVIGGDGTIGAQSRNRTITPEQDNAGFAAWVYANAESLTADLGPGYHYGEWWGRGIQRGYGQEQKRFSLFNVSRWDGVEFATPGLGVVPVLYRGPFTTDEVAATVRRLAASGSIAAPGFMRPEGVIVYHLAAGQLFKVTVERDEEPKGRTKF